MTLALLSLLLLLCHALRMAFSAKVFKILLLPAVTMVWKMLSPSIGQYLPIFKDVVHWHPGIQYDPSTQYPITDFIALVEQHGYDAEEHKVTTSDGYILRLHRISGGPKSPTAPGKPVVLIQHGILLSSDSWVLIGPKHDLPFLLVDAGYDVWLGNTRGNTYSREHVTLHRDSDEFWEFSYHEMGIYDTPAFIDTILSKTGTKKLTYIGYSMGTTVSYVLLSMLPKYNNKIDKLFSLAPVANFEYETRKFTKFVQELQNPLTYFNNFFGINEILPQSALAAFVGDKFCGDDDALTQPLCAKIFCQMLVDCKRMNKTALPNILAHFPGGISKLTIAHQVQNTDKKTFRAYDYGGTKNKAMYGQDQPPYYDLRKITVPVSVVYAESDDIINPNDAVALSRKLPNLVSLHLVDNKNFNHLDFLYSKDVRQLVYNQIVSTISG